MSFCTTRNSQPQQQDRQSGFTLIELMVVVAVIGILAALAFPSYTEYVRAAKRADMQRALSEAEQFMRRYYSARDSFEDAELPAGLRRSPRESAVAAYTIELVNADGDVVEENPSATAYTLRATRSDGMTGDRCGDLSVTQTGARTIENNASGTTLAECFKGS